MEYSAEQIKDLYCKFTCVFCQIDNYIQELKDHNFIK